MNNPIGDSGGPLMVQDLTTQKWTQIGIVHGSIGACGDVNYPGIYVRINHPTVNYFISNILENKTSPPLQDLPNRSPSHSESL